MYIIKRDREHVRVYDQFGRFLFSADNESEAWEEIEEYAKSAA